jgi:formylglycine-generating enzyme required for sulfatase activity
MSCCAVPERDTAAPPPPVAEAARPPRPDRLVHIPGGRVTIGTDRSPLPQDGETPARRVELKPFAIDPLAVTNAWFAAFVAATSYRTEAERFGWSLVFHPVATPTGTPDWWRRTDGACWRHPQGPGSIAAPDHPAVHISWNDATAFATWAGGRLPTEAEWEHAAAGGLPNPRYPWGNTEPDDTTFLPCNIWQGDFPHHDTAADGHAGTAPVDHFAPNGYGLHNMAGNIWEWCADGFRIRSLSRSAKHRNEQSRAGNHRLLKGGSFLCHRSYCHRYRIAARTGAGADSSTCHVGFRLAFDPA